MDVNPLTNGDWKAVAAVETMRPRMTLSQPTLKELLDAAARPYRALWKDWGGEISLNLSAVSRYCAKHGRPLSEADLSRLYSGKQAPGDITVDVLHEVFKIPRAMLRGEDIGWSRLQEEFPNVTMEIYLLARRISTLGKEDYYQVNELVELLERKQEQLRQAIKSSANITPIKRER